jgi:hypothetical protein
VSAERVRRASSALAASIFRSQPPESGVAEKAVFKPIKRQPDETASGNKVIRDAVSECGQGIRPMFRKALLASLAPNSNKKLI